MIFFFRKDCRIKNKIISTILPIFIFHLLATSVNCFSQKYLKFEPSVALRVQKLNFKNSYIPVFGVSHVLYLSKGKYVVSPFINLASGANIVNVGLGCKAYLKKTHLLANALNPFFSVYKPFQTKSQTEIQDLGKLNVGIGLNFTTYSENKIEFSINTLNDSRSYFYFEIEFKKNIKIKKRIKRKDTLKCPVVL